MIKIITIEREYGCGGGEIAQLVAKRLGWKLWDQLLTEEIARLANCPKAVVEAREERNDPLYYRRFKSFMSNVVVAMVPSVAPYAASYPRHSPRQ